MRGCVAVWCALLAVACAMPRFVGQYITNIEVDAFSGPPGSKSNAAAYYDSIGAGLMFTVSASSDRLNTLPNNQWNIVSRVPFTGEYVSLALVAGRPAVSYFNSGTGTLGYALSANAFGTLWGAPLYVDGNTTANVGLWTSLTTLSGNTVPAIAYQDNSLQPEGGVKFIKALDALGTSWSSPVLVASGPSIGQYISLVVAGGFPAISYHDPIGNALYFVRAKDANGAQWNAPVRIDDGGVLAKMVLNAAGIPHIVYLAPARIKIAAASDASGTAFTLFDGPANGAATVVDTTGLSFVFINNSATTQVPLVVHSYASATTREVLMSRTALPLAPSPSWSTQLSLINDNVTYPGGVSVAIVSGIPTAMWFDQAQGYVYLRQSTTSAALALNSSVFLLDTGVADRFGASAAFFSAAWVLLAVAVLALL